MGIHNKTLNMISRISSLFLTLISTVSAFGRGAPNYDRVCKDMSPGHWKTPQSSSIPLTVSNIADIESISYSSEQYIKFELKGKFDGILLQVRDAAGKNPVGEFCQKMTPNNGLKFVNCGKLGEKSTLSHSNGYQSKTAATV